MSGRRLWHAGGRAGRTTESSLNDTPCTPYSINSETEVFDVIQRIEYPKYIHATLDGLLAEFMDNIVGVAGVANSICTAKQHLERHIRNLFTQLL